MNIKGIDGLSPADVRALVKQGGRFVVYEWCVSVVLLTIKRGSNIHFLKPGESGFGYNFLWSSLTLLFGWWGFPWGPIYTVEALFTNVRGGTDVTSDILSHLPEASEQPEMLPLREGMGTVGGSTFNAAPLVALGGLVLIVLTFLGWLSAYNRDHMPVVLLNGTGASYSLSINGQPYQLNPYQYQQLELPEGKIEIQAALPYANSSTSISINTDEVSVDGDKITVINPDASALVIKETTKYAANLSSVGAAPKPVVLAGQCYYVMKKPDHLMEEFPATIQMPTDVGVVERTRVFSIRRLSLAEKASSLAEYGDEKAREDFIQTMGRLHPRDVELLSFVDRDLSIEQRSAFYAQHLQTRPVLVEWHRHYQSLAWQKDGAGAVLEQYRKHFEEEPQEGGFAYLYARLLDDDKAADQLYERALLAPIPAPDAHRGLAFNLFNSGKVDDSLKQIDQGLAAGLDPLELYPFLQDVLLFSKKPADLLARLRKIPITPATAFNRVERESMLVYMTEGTEKANAVIDAYWKALPPADRKQFGEAYKLVLQGELAYYRGDNEAYARSFPSNWPAWTVYNASLCTGDLEAAVKALETYPEASGKSWFVIYIAAKLAGRADAETYWQEGLRRLAKEGPLAERLRKQMSGELPVDPGVFAEFSAYSEEKRVYLAAMALRLPAYGREFAELALKFNGNPEFPAHLVREAARKASEATQSVQL